DEQLEQVARRRLLHKPERPAHAGHLPNLDVGRHEHNRDQRDDEDGDRIDSFLEEHGEHLYSPCWTHLGRIPLARDASFCGEFAVRITAATRPGLCAELAMSSFPIDKKKLRTLRQNKGWTQEELGEKLNHSDGKQISRIETTGRCALETAEALADILGV